MPLFLSNSCHFSVHKTEISKFLARIHMKYFRMGIFVIPGVCLIRKYWSQTTAFFLYFSASRGTMTRLSLFRHMIIETYFHWFSACKTLNKFENPFPVLNRYFYQIKFFSPYLFSVAKFLVSFHAHHAIFHN